MRTIRRFFIIHRTSETADLFRLILGRYQSSVYPKSRLASSADIFTSCFSLPCCWDCFHRWRCSFINDRFFQQRLCCQVELGLSIRRAIDCQDFRIASRIFLWRYSGCPNSSELASLPGSTFAFMGAMASFFPATYSFCCLRWVFRSRKKLEGEKEKPWTDLKHRKTLKSHAPE